MCLDRFNPHPTTRWGMDFAWEQEKLEARKMLENAADSHTSGARFVGREFGNILFLQSSC